MTTAGSIDFKHSFREEARETVADLEATLLALNECRVGSEGDPEQERERVGRVFRALHTIKGSGAMFGFDALSGFTHNLENAFDAVRQGRLAVTAELTDVTLSALDQIRAMVEADGGAAVAHPVCAGA